MGDDAPRPKYLVANADEMEPGTFKDRLLLEGDPHQLIEGMILAPMRSRRTSPISSCAANTSWRPRQSRQAIAEAYETDYLGKNILGSDYSLELYLHVSAGRYMCGEETGLLNALEGKRANPRSKPPFPQVSAASGASRPSSTTSKRSATCRTSSTTARSGSRG